MNFIHSPNYFDIETREIILNLNENQENIIKQAPYFYHCRKWIISLNDQFNDFLRNKNQNNKILKLLKQSEFIKVLKLKCNFYDDFDLSFIDDLKNAIYHVSFLSITQIYGYQDLLNKLISNLNMTNLKCLELTKFSRKKNISNILNTIFNETINLISFRFEATESLINNNNNNEFVKFPMKIQWISITKWTNYFNLDLRECHDIIGLNICDIEMNEDSILWPYDSSLLMKRPSIQCLTIESFQEYRTKYIQRWNEYIYLNKFKLNVIRFIKYKHFKFSFDLNVLNQSINGSECDDIHKLKYWAIQQDQGNDYGILQNPYYLYPLYFTNLGHNDKKELFFQILLQSQEIKYIMDLLQEDIDSNYDFNLSVRGIKKVEDELQQSSV